MTEYQGKIYISSRSIDEINVHSLWNVWDGDGSLKRCGSAVDELYDPGGKANDPDTIDEMIKEGDIQE